MFCDVSGRQVRDSDRSWPMSVAMPPWLRAASSTAVSSNHSWFRLNETRIFGVRSKSPPMPASTSPGFVKFDWPWPLFGRIELSRPFCPDKVTLPPPIRGTACRIQKLVSAPAINGFSKIASKPVDLSS